LERTRKCIHEPLPSLIGAEIRFGKSMEGSGHI
jgi:hypothetical protein